MRFIPILFTMLSASLHANDRIERDQLAKQELLKLHFFTEGRGMHLTPGLIETIDTKPGQPVSAGIFKNLFRDRYGFNVVKNEVIGLFSIPYKKRESAVIGCVACHSGRAAGVFVPGLGNKNIDVLRIAKDAYQAQKLLTPLFGEGEYKETHEGALQFAKNLTIDRLGNLTQGLVTVSFIRSWFYRQAGIEIPEDMTRGAVKVPALWGYGVKRFAGQFSDGFGNGALPGWAIAVELTAGQTVETVRTYLPKIEHAEAILGDLLPPAYPLKVDAPLAAKGETVFLKTCAGCHGTYERDSDGIPIFKAPNWIPWNVVQTDFDRLQSNTPEFYDLVAHNPLNDILQATTLGQGYFAPRLVSIWARFPYLHNGSVPTVWDLLTPTEQRPQVFSLYRSGDANRFDQGRLGLTRPDVGTKDEKSLLDKATLNSREIYFTKRIGQTASGHPFGTRLPVDEKLALIEYLKTL